MGRFGLGQRLPRFRRIGFNHLQSRAREQFLRIDARRFDSGRRSDARFFDLDGFRSNRLSNRGRRGRVGLGFPWRRGLVVRLRFRLVHFGFALLLQPVFLELLRIHGLIRARLFRTRLIRPAFSTLWTIAAISPAATAAAAPTAMLIAFLRRWSRAIQTGLLRTLLLRTRRPLIRTALTLRTLDRLAFDLR